MQQERRRDPYPFTWEIPVGVAGVFLVAGVLGVHLGRGLATLAFGGGWTWPASRRLFSSLFDVLGGDPVAGLGRAPGIVPTASALIGWIITAEIVLVLLAVVSMAWVLRRWGPGRMRGMATASDTERTLGVSRLRRVSRIIRPDLHPPRDRRGARREHHPA